MQARRHGRPLTLAIATTALLALASAASATTFCVPSIGAPPSCPAGGVTEPTVAAAIAAAGSSSGLDTIILAPGVFPETSLVAGVGNPVEVVGAGIGSTVITSPTSGTTTLRLDDPASTVSDLWMTPANNGTALALSGAAHRVKIYSVGTSTGVLLGASTASFAHGIVDMQPTYATMGVVGAAGGGTLEDTTVAAATGVVNVATVRRVRVTALTGIQFSPSFSASGTVDDALVQVAGATPGVGLVASTFPVAAPASATLTARHLTIVNAGLPGSTGISTAATGGIFPSANASTTLRLSDTILRGFGTDLSRTAISGPGTSGDANLDVDYSDYDPAKVTNTNLAGGTGTVTAGSHNLNVDPGFADATGGDFHLAGGSPLIDRGTPPPASPDEPTTDLDGKPRVVDGNGDGIAISDIGAFEYQPPPPPPPLPLPPLAPELSALELVPARFAVGPGTTARAATLRRRAPRGTTIHFRLSRAASVALTVQRPAAGRRSGRGCVKPTRRLRHARRCTRWVSVFRFTRHGTSGANSFAFSGRAGRRGRTPLAPGRYRLLAIATADGLSSRTRTARFTIVAR